jgi:hypothetical protein
MSILGAVPKGWQIEEIRSQFLAIMLGSSSFSSLLAHTNRTDQMFWPYFLVFQQLVSQRLPQVVKSCWQSSVVMKKFHHHLTFWYCRVQSANLQIPIISHKCHYVLFVWQHFLGNRRPPVVSTQVCQTVPSTEFQSTLLFLS